MLDALNGIYDWLTNGIFSFFSSAFSSLMEWLVVTAIHQMTWAIQFAWGIAQNVIQDLHISEQLNNSWSFLPASYKNSLTFFRIPEVLLNLISAYITKFVLKFIPGL